MSNAMMRTLASPIFAVFFLMASTGAQAGLQEGIDDYGKGNYPAALKEFEPLAAGGNAPAQSNLGFMYANGQGTPQDYEKAAMWYRKAAEQGEVDAQSNLGAMYASGQGVPKDDKEAASWYLKAAEQGNPPAQFNLGVMYANGQGVPQDLIQAHQWFSLAEIAVGDEAINNRKLVEADMTPMQIEEAQALVKEWLVRHK